MLFERAGQPSIVVALALSLGCSSEDAQPERTEGVTWCQALGVLESSCQRCHNDPAQNGAPFPLLTYDHTQADYPGTETPIRDKMRDWVGRDLMPPVSPFTMMLDPPVEPLTCEQKSTLLRWLDEGAQPTGGLDCAPADKTLIACDPELGSPSP